MIIWLASYPRSGNTYFRAVLNHYFNFSTYSLYGDLADIGANEALVKLVGHKSGTRETLNLAALRRSDERAFIKTHELPDDLISNEDAVFYILRDGRDASASYHRYLQNVLGRTDATLDDVLVGAVRFGWWGNHVLQWNRMPNNNRHVFRFEDITREPDVFAHRLAGILQCERSLEPFPELETFRNAAPSFFGTGRSGSHEDAFSGVHCALFDHFSGPAMHLTGYRSDALDDHQLAAYAIFCERYSGLTELIRKVEGLDAGLKNARRALHKARGERERLKKERERLEKDRERLEKERERLKTEIAFVKDRYDRLMKFTGLDAFRRLVSNARRVKQRMGRRG